MFIHSAMSKLSTCSVSTTIHTRRMPEQSASLDLQTSYWTRYVGLGDWLHTSSTGTAPADTSDNQYTADRHTPSAACGWKITEKTPQTMAADARSTTVPYRQIISRSTYVRARGELAAEPWGPARYFHRSRTQEWRALGLLWRRRSDRYWKWKTSRHLHNNELICKCLTFRATSRSASWFPRRRRCVSSIVRFPIIFRLHVTPVDYWRRRRLVDGQPCNDHRQS